MDLPDESQWDETTCDLAVCQHPQCWATIRRIERGHPRLLDSSSKSFVDAEDKLPVLTIVNITDSCFPTKRVIRRRHLPGFTFTKAHSLLSSKFDSKFQGRPWKDLPDRDLMNRTDRSPKLSVLNLNETKLPCPQDVGNMDVIWIPEKHVSPAEEKHLICSQDGNMNRKKSPGKHKSELPGIIVPPPTPAHLYEQLSSESLPLWNQFDMLPQDLLKDLLLDKGKTILYPEMRTQLAMMKKKPPLEKSRPNSAISAKMYLSVHRLTLQKPALRYPEHLKKHCSNLKTDGRFSDAARSPGTIPSRLELILRSLGRKTLRGQQSDKKRQQQQMKTRGPPSKQDSTERPQTNVAKKFLDSSRSKKSPELSQIEYTKKDIKTQMEILLEDRTRTPKSASSVSWNPELKLLRILQATDEEDEEIHPSGAQSEVSEVQAEGCSGSHSDLGT
uniref:Chromosome 9 open reading frame 43 n=1 Tax=Capra hircus TaxID=9925 RepID=A0A452E2I2_CAPHI